MLDIDIIISFGCKVYYVIVLMQLGKKTTWFLTHGIQTVIFILYRCTKTIWKFKINSISEYYVKLNIIKMNPINIDEFSSIPTINGSI